MSRGFNFNSSFSKSLWHEHKCKKILHLSEFTALTSFQYRSLYDLQLKVLALFGYWLPAVLDGCLRFVIEELDMSKETGGPAFPELGNVGHNSDWLLDNGMTLRDYFAAKAMASLIGGGHRAGLIASRAYEIADAMLAERSKS